MRNVGLFTLLVLVAPLSRAEGFSVSLNAGTLGWGVDVATGIFEQVDARLAFNASKSPDFTLVDPSRFNGVSSSRRDLELLADWHPFDNGFRTSLGLVYYSANHKLTKTSSIAQVVTTTTRDNGLGSFILCLATLGLVCGDVISETSTSTPWADFGTHSYDVRYRTFAPYLGIGYGSAVSKRGGFGFTADVGAFYRGVPSVTSTFACGSSNPEGTPTCNAYRDALSAESEAMKANYPRWMPKLSVGMKYDF